MNHRSDRPYDPASLFTDYLTRREHGEEVDFEALVAAHPEHAEELRSLKARDDAIEREICGVLPRSDPTEDSFFRRVRDMGTSAFGDEDSLVPGASLQPGDTLGDFHLIGILGSGGMGQVWEAEEVSMRRRVALKVVLPERISDRALTLFAREARAGGKLSHPCIVGVFGYGETDGVHWINQELVEGGWTLRDFIEEMRRADSIPEDYYARVAGLAVELARALQVAHDAGVIHRDVKPRNILIGPDDKPKIGDFGLARISGETALTQSGDFAGTYLYMSPEQVAARRMGLDHRSDIFSLGVVFYELLGLQRPFEGDTTHQIAEKILTWDPPDLHAWRSRIPSDLSVIAGKMLEKRPLDRYQSMAEVADDIERHLHDEPIVARPPGPIERGVKWCRRHRGIAVSGALAILALVTISTLAWRIAREKARTDELRLEAVERTRDLEKVSAFLSQQLEALVPDEMGWGTRQELLNLIPDPGRSLEQPSRGTNPRRQLLETSLAGLDFEALGKWILDTYFLTPALEAVEKLEDQPRVQAELLRTLGSMLQESGLFERAEGPLRRSLEIRQRKLGDDDPDTLRSVDELASILQDRGKLQKAEPLFRRALEGRRRALGEHHRDTITTLGNLAGVLHDLGRLPEAEVLSRQALVESREEFGNDDPDTLIAINNLASLLHDRGNAEEAEKLFRTALDGRRRTLGPDDRHSIASLNNLATLLMEGRKLKEAEPLMREALERSRRVLGRDHPDTLVAMNNLARLLQFQGNRGEAESEFRQALEGSRRVLGEDHPLTMGSLNNLASVLHDEKKLDEAEPLFREALEGARRLLGPNHTFTLSTLNNLASVLQDEEKFDEAEPLYREALAGFRLVLGSDHESTLSCLINLASLLKKKGRLDEAEPMYREALALLRQTHGDDDPSTLVCLAQLARLYVLMDRPDDALPLAEELVRLTDPMSPREGERIQLLKDLRRVVGNR